jgi:hypothetical protein
MANDPSRKSILEIAPGYLAGIAAIATAAIGVLTFVDKRAAGPDPVPADRPQGAATDSAPDPALSDGCRRIVGSWQWYTGDIAGVLTFGADQQVGASLARGSPPLLLGSWTCDGASGAYTIRWQNRVIEQVTLGSDGRTASGFNNLNNPIRGSALQ